MMAYHLLTIAALLLSLGSHAQRFECTSDTFPDGYGSSLQIEYQERAHFYAHEASLLLNHSGGITPTAGWYDGFSSINENGTPVVFLQWKAGSGISEELTLIPNRIVVYAPEASYGHNKTLFVGIIEWRDGNKIETHHSYKCL